MSTVHGCIRASIGHQHPSLTPQHCCAARLSPATRTLDDLVARPERVLLAALEDVCLFSAREGLHAVVARVAARDRRARTGVCMTMDEVSCAMRCARPARRPPAASSAPPPLRLRCAKKGSGWVETLSSGDGYAVRSSRQLTQIGQPLSHRHIGSRTRTAQGESGARQHCTQLSQLRRSREICSTTTRAKDRCTAWVHRPVQRQAGACTLLACPAVPSPSSPSAHHDIAPSLHVSRGRPTRRGRPRPRPLRLAVPDASVARPCAELRLPSERRGVAQPG